MLHVKNWINLAKNILLDNANIKRKLRMKSPGNFIVPFGLSSINHMICQKIEWDFLE